MQSPLITQSVLIMQSASISPTAPDETAPAPGAGSASRHGTGTR